MGTSNYNEFKGDAVHKSWYAGIPKPGVDHEAENRRLKRKWPV